MNMCDRCASKGDRICVQAVEVVECVCLGVMRYTGWFSHYSTYYPFPPPAPLNICRQFAIVAYQPVGMKTG